MELIDEGQPFRVVVDIASTEQAMRNVLRMLQRGDDRASSSSSSARRASATRRAGVASRARSRELADFAVITNEDPRGEDPEPILDEIAGGAEGRRASRRKFERELDRRQAIEIAFEQRGERRHGAAGREGHRAVDRHRQHALAVGRAPHRAGVAAGVAWRIISVNGELR